MNLDQLDVRAISAKDARPLRRAVLRPTLPPEQSVYPGDDDPRSFHLGVFLDDRLVSVATFLPEACPVDGRDRDWRLRGMATLDDVRSLGIGGRLLTLGIRTASDRNGTLLWCYGRAEARRFYERHGMHVVGDEFELANTGPLYLMVVDLGAAPVDVASSLELPSAD